MSPALTQCVKPLRACPQDLRNKYGNSFQSMLPPFSHLDDCAGNHYRLQLNCYKFILEKYYGFFVVDMYVVCTHPDNVDRAFVDHVPVMGREVERLMAFQRSRAEETLRLSLEDSVEDDPLGGGTTATAPTLTCLLASRRNDYF